MPFVSKIQFKSVWNSHLKEWFWISSSMVNIFCWIFRYYLKQNLISLSLSNSFISWLTCFQLMGPFFYLLRLESSGHPLPHPCFLPCILSVTKSIHCFSSFSHLDPSFSSLPLFEPSILLTWTPDLFLYFMSFSSNRLHVLPQEQDQCHQHTIFPLSLHCR